MREKKDTNDNINIPYNDEEFFNIYNPDLALIYLNTVKSYNRTTPKNRQNMMLRFMRICTKDPTLNYSLSTKKSGQAKLKHFVTPEEIEKFLIWLDIRKKFQTKFIVELLWKFGVRIGAIAKLTRSSVRSDDVIFFQEKNNKIVTRKLMKTTLERLNHYIRKNKSENNYHEYIFFPKISPNDIDKRCKAFSYLVIKAIKSSGSFPKDKYEQYTSHMFRASRIVYTTRESNIETAQKEAGHTSSNTTYYNYYQPERRGIWENIEEKIEKDNPTICKLLNKKRKKIKNTLDEEIDKEHLDNYMNNQPIEILESNHIIFK